MGNASTSVGPVRRAPLGNLLIERALREVTAVGRALGVALPGDVEAKILGFVSGLPDGMRPVLAVGPVDLPERAEAGFAERPPGPEQAAAGLVDAGVGLAHGEVGRSPGVSRAPMTAGTSPAPRGRTGCSGRSGR